MATIKGFKGIRYNPDKVGDLSKVIAPPYDVIDQQGQEEFYQLSQYNVIRLILAKGHEDDRYKNAGATFQEWLSDSVLIQEDHPCIYPYYQEFEAGGEFFTRKGFVATVKIEDFASKKIFPHEQTFRKHKEDRLKLTTACNANMSQVFAVYPDQSGEVEKLIDGSIQEPIMSTVTKDGVNNKLWKIADQAVINEISFKLMDKSLLIADGHHRYETAINFRNKQRNINGEDQKEKPYDHVMMYLSRSEGAGLIINPTHRVVKKIGMPEDKLLQKVEKYFELRQLEEDKICNLAFDQIAVVLGSVGSGYVLSPKLTYIKHYQNLAVMQLHNLIFKEIINEENAGILYTKSENELYDLVRNHEYEAGFLLPKIKASDIFEVVLDGEKMPHKTTYFYPKILSGMVFNPLW